MQKNRQSSAIGTAAAPIFPYHERLEKLKHRMKISPSSLSCFRMLRFDFEVGQLRIKDSARSFASKEAHRDDPCPNVKR